MPDYDLILKGGHVLDPSQGLVAVMDIGFLSGRVVALDRNLNSKDATEARDVSGKLVTPGLIDMHTHVYQAGGHPSVLTRSNSVRTVP